MRLDSILCFIACVSLGGCVVPESVGDHDSEATQTATETDPPDGSGTTDGETDGTTDGETGEALECFGLPDEAACLAAGCTEFHTVLQVSDACACTQNVPACLQFTGGIGGAASPDYFWHEATGTVVMFDTSWIELPVGWRRCTDAGAPAACGCFEPFMGPECP